MQSAAPLLTSQGTATETRSSARPTLTPARSIDSRCPGGWPAFAKPTLATHWKTTGSSANRREAQNADLMGEISKLETTASEACTRGGAFALLLSLALASLIPVWSHRKDEIILGRYLTLRLNLVAALDALDENPIWQEYKLAHDTESVPLKQLADILINSNTLAPFNNSPQDTPSTKPPTPTPRANPSGPTDPPDHHTGLDVEGFVRIRPAAYHVIQNGPTCKPTDPGCPGPPTGLAFVVGFEEAQQAADYLAQLNDSDLLTRSRNASDVFNFSIYRWVLKRDNLIAQSARKGPLHATKVDGVPNPRAPANFAPAADEAALLNLTLGAVRELAKAELPPISNTVKLGPNEPEVDLTPGSLPRSLYGASLFGQLLLFFVIIYFDAFARKAVSATHFPSQETLFGAFAGARPTLAVFLLALWTPSAVSLGILLVSFGGTSIGGTLGLALCSVLIGLASLSVNASLNSRFYFRPLV
jgi:hypothetical protein